MRSTRRAVARERPATAAASDRVIVGPLLAERTEDGKALGERVHEFLVVTIVWRGPEGDIMRTVA